MAATHPPQLGKRKKSASSSSGKSDVKAKKARRSDDKSLDKKRVRDNAEEPAASMNENVDGEGQMTSDDLPPASKKLKKTYSASNESGFDGGTSRESHAKQKKLALDRKAAKPLADEVQRTKKIWEKLRRKREVDKEERQQLVQELYGIVSGRCRDFVLKHDAVRAVQTAIKYSSPQQRKEIARELEGSYAQLAEGRYAKFLIGKLMVQNDDEIRDMIINNFYGKVRKLINHAEASWILDDIYRTAATKEQKAILLREWYGPEFSLRELTKDVTKPTADLKAILDQEAGKRGPIMKSLLDMINSLVQKRMTGFTMLHDAMLQYFLNTQPGTEERNEFVEMIKGDESGDLLKNMAFTKSGAMLTCLLLAHGSAKDRKQVLKTYKDTFLLMSGDAYAHVVILTAYDVIDDTKLVSKSIFPELFGEKEAELAQNIVGTVNNANARTTILYLLEGLSKSLFPASHAFDLDVLKTVHEIRQTTSKKDNDTRRRELVAAMSGPLLSAIAAAPSELTSTAFGCQFIADVFLSPEVDGKDEALKAVAQCAAGEAKEQEADDDLTARPHLSRTPHGGRMLKSLIQGGRYDKATGKVVPVEPRLGFAELLYPIIKDYIIDWATGPSSFAIVAMLEADDFGKAEALKKTLRKNRKLLEKAANEPQRGEEKGSEAESSKKQKKKQQKQKGAGNVGSRLLLEKL